MAKKEKKPGRGKRFLKVLLCIIIVIALFAGVTTVITVISSNANLKKAMTFEPVKYENQLVPTKEGDYWTFTTDDDLKVLQLTDVHFGGGWMCAKKDSMAMNAVAAMVTAEKPDLVVVTGDIAYPVPFQAGTFNNKTGAKMFATLMDQLGVYWTMVMGNHDTEAYSYYTREEIGEYYEKGDWKYCLFMSGPEDVFGAGNQVIKVKNSEGIITQALIGIDSNSYTDGDILGVRWAYDNIHEDQIKWYDGVIDELNQLNNERYLELGMTDRSDVRTTLFFHIPPEEMLISLDEYYNNGYKDTEDVKYNYGDAGESKKIIYCPIHPDNFIETVLEKGSTKDIFFGHDHKNNISFNYKGVNLTYGMSVDYLAYPGIYKLGSQRGCTVIDIAPDGSVDFHAENYYQDKYTAQYEKEKVEMQDVPLPVVTSAEAE